MNRETAKRWAEEVLAWAVMVALLAIGLHAYEFMRKPAPEPTRAEVVTYATNALRAEEVPDAGEVVSEPGEPQVIANADGSITMFGTASWYDYTFDRGSDFGRPCYRTRERCWTEDKDVAAMRGIPRGRGVTVTNLANGKSVDVTVTDYGPDEALHPGRIIDLSSHAFAAIAGLGDGLVEVKVEWGK